MEQDKRYRIGKVFISVTDMNSTICRIHELVRSKTKGLICVSNMRTTCYANKHADYRMLMEKALMCLPDGTPLVWMARLWGLKMVQRTAGPDVFLKMLQDKSIKHFLLGDTDATCQAIMQKYSDANIVGYYAPPFGDVQDFNYQEIAKPINDCEADIVWISLRAPKQDFFAERLLPLLNQQLCIGVGAAFRFALGELRHPNKWVRRLGLTGFLWRKNKVKVFFATIRRTFILLGWSIDILWSKIIRKERYAE